VGNDLSRLIAAFDEPPGTVPVRTLLCLIRDALGLTNVAYLATYAPPLTREGPFIEVTYSAAWVDHYKAQGYVNHDPVLTEPSKSILPTDWSTLDKSSFMTRKLFQDAERFGIGNQGATIPIRGVNNERAFFSVTKNANWDEWVEFKRATMPLIAVAANVFHETVMKGRGVVYPQIHLSKREVEVLGWAAAGKAAPDISVILGISVSTVRAHLDTARHKLSAVTIAHAVRRAIDANLITPPE
jgi:LuxR family transcriptional regulator, quorum-sensing system regulator SinR